MAAIKLIIAQYGNKDLYTLFVFPTFAHAKMPSLAVSLAALSVFKIIYPLARPHGFCLVHLRPILDIKRGRPSLA